MQNRLLGSLFKKQLIQIAYLCKTAYQDLFLKKITYSKQLIYAKQLIRIFSKQLIQNSLFMQNNLLGSLFQNNLFKTAYLCKTAY